MYFVVHEIYKLLVLKKLAMQCFSFLCQKKSLVFPRGHIVIIVSNQSMNAPYEKVNTQCMPHRRHAQKNSDGGVHIQFGAHQE
jgi:hypothetical protein